MHSSIEARLQQGLATSKDLQVATGWSQSSVSRRLRELGDRVVRVQRGRTTYYALAINAFGAGHIIPLHRVDPYGNHVLIARVYPLAHGGFFVAPETGMPRALAGATDDGLYDDLPYFLEDLRPQGFLGREIAHGLAGLDERFPADPKRWGTDQIGRYLVANGDDLPGDMILGEQIHLRLPGRPVPATDSDYPGLAEAVLAGEVPGSSAGGEQPKFTAYRPDVGPVIVKFSPPGDSPLASRRRDILITEHHAALTLLDHGMPSATTRLVEAGDRLFLESVRFDRHGERGRLPMISLRAVDAEFTGLGPPWPAVMEALVEQDLISVEHVAHTRFMWAFGRAIHNTDMHLGNLSLGLEGNVFRLLPAYDMCSMGFAPHADEVRPLVFTPPEITASGIDQPFDRLLRQAVVSFWQAVAGDPLTSAELQAFIRKQRLTHLDAWSANQDEH